MLIKKSLLTLTITCLLATSSSFASDSTSAQDKGANFGGPDAVDNQIAEDNRKSQPDFKTQLEQNNISMGLDYSSVFLGANNVLPGSDDNAGSGMVRFYGSWNPIGVGTTEVGGLVWKVEAQTFIHRYIS